MAKIIFQTLFQWSDLGLESVTETYSLEGVDDGEEASQEHTDQEISGQAEHNEGPGE